MLTGAEWGAVMMPRVFFHLLLVFLEELPSKKMQSLLAKIPSTEIKLYFCMVLEFLFMVLDELF